MADVAKQCQAISDELSTMAHKSHPTYLQEKLYLMHLTMLDAEELNLLQGLFVLCIETSFDADRL